MDDYDVAELILGIIGVTAGIMMGVLVFFMAVDLTDEANMKRRCQELPYEEYKIDTRCQELLED